MKYKFKKKIISNSDRYRLHIFRSNKNIFIQVIDDSIGSTVSNASSLKLKGGRNSSNAQILGKQIGTSLVDKGIKKLFLDRGRLPYKGLIKLVCDSARETGLEF